MADKAEQLAARAVPMPQRKPATAISEKQLLNAIKEDIFAQLGFDYSKIAPPLDPDFRDSTLLGLFDPEKDQVATQNAGDVTALAHEFRHRGFKRFAEEKRPAKEEIEVLGALHKMPRLNESREEVLMRMGDHMYAEGDNRTGRWLQYAGVPVGSARKQDDDLVVRVYQAMKFLEGVARGRDE